MKTVLMSATVAVALCAATVPIAMAGPGAAMGVRGQEEVALAAGSDLPAIRRESRRQQYLDVGYQRGRSDTTPYANNGGYVVNRYGFGNYVGGPGGGFAGYPAGSAGAQVYKQRQEWKCEAVPERC